MGNNKYNKDSDATAAVAEAGYVMLAQWLSMNIRRGWNVLAVGICHTTELLSHRAILLCRCWRMSSSLSLLKAFVPCLITYPQRISLPTNILRS